MSAVRSRDTRPELLLRSRLWHRGMRYRLRSTLPGKPDIVFPRPRVAVFVDGDFWHGNAWQARRLPSFEAQFDHMSNADFWRKKITSNMLRDERVNAELTASGWTVYRVFESRLSQEIDAVCQEIEKLVRQRRPSSGPHPVASREDRTHA
jgi:DNA mismatch endonuclease (patch repair protein)